MTKPVQTAFTTAILTGVVLIIPATCIAEAITAGALSGEVVARWLALSVTFLGMVASAGISYGVTKATMEVKMAGMKETLKEQKDLLKEIFAALKDRPTIDGWKELRALETELNASKYTGVKEAVDALRKDFSDFRKSMGDQRHEHRG